MVSACKILANVVFSIWQQEPLESLTLVHSGFVHAMFHFSLFSYVLVRYYSITNYIQKRVLLEDCFWQQYN